MLLLLLVQHRCLIIYTFDNISTDQLLGSVQVLIIYIYTHTHIYIFT